MTIFSREEIVLSNPSGHVSVSRTDGCLTIANADGIPIVKNGHCRVETSTHAIVNRVRDTLCEIDAYDNKSALLTWKAPEYPGWLTRLHITNSMSHFSFTMTVDSIPNSSERVRGLFPLAGDWDGEFTRSMHMLRFAYCGANTGNPLSKSGLIPLFDETMEDSWWAASFFTPPGLRGFVLGYEDFSHFAGRIYANCQRFACEVPVDTDKNITESPALLVFPAHIVNDALKSYADIVSNTMRARDRISAPVAWGTWANYQENITDDIVLREALSLRSSASEFAAINAIQIDHGWEERIAIHRPFSSWQPRQEFCKDMRSFIDRLHGTGFNVGLWVCPFVINRGDPFGKNHPEYLVKDIEGRPFRIGGKGGAFCIDPTHPGAREYLRRTFNRFLDWGVDYFKLDFLRCLLSPDPEDSEDRLDLRRSYFSGVSRVEAYRDGLALIREIVGNEVFLLGSGAPLGPSIGYLDGIRIGQDISQEWHDGVTGVRDCSRNMMAMYPWNRRFWINDPDYLLSVPNPEIMRYWAGLVATSGGLVTLSCCVGELEHWQKEIFASVLPPVRHTPVPVEWNNGNKPFVWGFHIECAFDDWWLLACFNCTHGRLKCCLEPEKIGLDPDVLWCAWGFWRETFIGFLKDENFGFFLDGNSSEILVLRKVYPHPYLLGTTMHFCQGEEEISDVSWDGKKNTLRVVFSEPFAEVGGKIAIQVPRGFKLVRILGGHAICEGIGWLLIERQISKERDATLFFDKDIK